nr:hypothetical protein Iba_chr15dCG7140 [Ipomoea batatas]
MHTRKGVTEQPPPPHASARLRRYRLTEGDPPLSLPAILHRRKEREDHVVAALTPTACRLFTPATATNRRGGPKRRRPPWPSPLPSPSGERRRELQVAASATVAGEETHRRLRKLASRLLLYHRRIGEELAAIETPTPETAIAAAQCRRLMLPNSDVDQRSEGERKPRPVVAAGDRRTQLLLWRNEGAKGLLTGPASQLPLIPEASEQAPTPASSI